jgi:cell wall-associated NlpC family hydrolase
MTLFAGLRIGLAAAALVLVSSPAIATAQAPVRGTQQHHHKHRAKAKVAGPKARVAVKAARTQLGVLYVWGGATPRGFDCSGLVVWSYGKAGRQLPHYTGTLFGRGVRVRFSRMLPGDLVFFGYGPSHVGIYLGRGRMIEAPKPGKRVRIIEITNGFYRSWFSGAVRIVPAQRPQPPQEQPPQGGTGRRPLETVAAVSSLP